MGFVKRFNEFVKGIYETCDLIFFNVVLVVVVVVVVVVLSTVQFILFLHFASIISEEP